MDAQRARARAPRPERRRRRRRSGTAHASGRSELTAGIPGSRSRFTGYETETRPTTTAPAGVPTGSGCW